MIEDVREGVTDFVAAVEIDDVEVFWRKWKHVEGGWLSV